MERADIGDLLVGQPHYRKGKLDSGQNRTLSGCLGVACYCRSAANRAAADHGPCGDKRHALRPQPPEAQARFKWLKKPKRKYPDESAPYRQMFVVDSRTK